MALPASHRIPPETISRIVDEVDKNVLWQKKELAVYSLVCRYWARHFRPPMFRDIVLRNKTDFEDLLRLIVLSSAVAVVPPLAECLYHIDIAHSGDWQMPWIHKLPLVQRHTVQPILFFLRARDLDARCAARLWAASLPRDLPGNNWLLSSLDIIDARFRRVSDLVRAVRDLPKLYRLHCHRISFDDEYIPRRRARGRQRRCQCGQDVLSLEILIGECGGTQMERELSFLLMSEMYHRRYRFLKDRVWNTFRELLVALKVPSVCDQRLLGDGESLSMLAVSFVYCITRYSNNPLIDHIVKSSTLEFYDPYAGFLRFEADSSPGSRSDVYVSLQLETTPWEVMICDWDALETAIFSLVPVPILHLSVEIEDVFKATLEAVLDGRILRRLNNFGRLDLQFRPKPGDAISAEQILAQPAECNIDNCRIFLSPVERFGLMVSKDEGDKIEYLRRLLASSTG